MLLKILFFTFVCYFGLLICGISIYFDYLKYRNLSRSFLITREQYFLYRTIYLNANKSFDEDIKPWMLLCGCVMIIVSIFV